MMLVGFINLIHYHANKYICEISLFGNKPIDILTTGIFSYKVYKILLRANI